MKDEVLEWLLTAVLQGMAPFGEQGHAWFCEFLGLSPRVVERDLAELLDPVYAEFCVMHQTLGQSPEFRREAARFADSPRGHDLPAKLELVERYKPAIRESLKAYGGAVRELNGDPSWWAHAVVERGLAYPTCLNADTRYRDGEGDYLRGAGWVLVYLWIDRATQRRRRPTFTDEQAAHPSETSIGPADCDFTIDARQPLAAVLIELARCLSAGPAEA
jgi:hypothetical protein